MNEDRRIQLHKLRDLWKEWDSIMTCLIDKERLKMDENGYFNRGVGDLEEITEKILHRKYKVVVAHDGHNSYWEFDTPEDLTFYLLQHIK